MVTRKGEEMSQDQGFLQKVMRWSVERAGASLDKVPESANELTQAQKEHFFAAVDNAAGVDIPKRMGAIGQQLLALDRSDTGSLLELLDELLEHVEKIDHANDLHTVGGLQPVLQLAYSGASSEIRSVALQIASTVAQNNLQGQETLLKQDAHYTLLSRANDSSEDAAVRAQALTALASLARGHPNATSTVLREGGVDAAIGALKDGLSSERVRRKALQLLRYYAQCSDEALAKLVDANAVEHTVPLMSSEDTIAREQSAGLLCDIAKNTNFNEHPSAIDQLRSDALQTAAQNRKQTLQELTGDEAEAVQGERANVEALMSMLQHGGQG